MARFGTLFTPGYNGNINYPNFVTCVWRIIVQDPIALKFSDDAALQDVDHSRDNNKDVLEVQVSTLTLFLL